jgi:2-keto-3-deoxy-L-rhamnonate aldolase RhmA
VEQVEEITKVPGIHVLFIGPRDLSHDLGVPGDTSAPAFQDALKRGLAVAEEAGLAAGILLPMPRRRTDMPTEACASSASAPMPPPLSVSLR